MDLKKVLRCLLLPHVSILILLLPVGTVFLVYSLLSLEETDPVRIASYVLAFYMLIVWCIRVPNIVRYVKNFKAENRYLQRWSQEPGLRVNITLICNVLWNCAYAAMQLGLGVYHRSSWFYSLAAYYASMAVMRIFLVQHTMRHEPGENLRKELIRYRICGWIFLFMNLALSGMMIYMIHQGRVVHHHEITTIAMAAYTFTTLTVAIINVVRYRKYNSPAMSASKAVSLASACVSMLTLENTMLATFSKTEMSPWVRSAFLSLSGGTVSIFIVVMAIYMIIKSNKRLRTMEK